MLNDFKLQLTILKGLKLGQLRSVKAIQMLRNDKPKNFLVES